MKTTSFTHTSMKRHLVVMFGALLVALTSLTPVVSAATASLNDTTIGTGTNQFSYTGTWHTATPAGAYLKNDHETNGTTATYSVKFSGQQIKIYSAKASTMGIAAYSIDGGTETKVDTYSASRTDNTLVYTSPLLTNGIHTLKVRNTGTKNTASTGAYMVADRADIVTPSSVKAFDSANTISDPAWFTKAYAAGFRLYVLNTTNWGTCDAWPSAQPQIKNALAAGLKVGAYTRDPSCWKNGILATGTYQSKLQFFALDVETDPGVPVTRAMVDGVKGMGVRPIIYSGSGIWAAVQGSTANSFSDVPLWDTNTSSFSYATWQANYLSPTPVQYGGWNKPVTMRVGVQQQFEYTLNGVNIDLNSFNADFLK